MSEENNQPEKDLNEEPTETRSNENTNFDFERMDKDVQEFRQAIRSRENPASETEEEDEYTDQVPPHFTPMRRRRRPNRPSPEPVVNDREKVTQLLEKATPNLDLFLLAFISGIIMGIGYLLDSNTILMFGIFMTPFLGPWIGLTLSSMIGEIKLFKLTAGGLFTSLFIAFTASAIVGFIARLMDPVGTTIQVYYHSHLYLSDLFMVVVGTILLALRFVQSKTQPIIPSLMLSYGIFLPLSVSGYGLGFGAIDLFINGILVFFIHLAVSLVIAFVLMLYLGFKPRVVNEYFLPGSLILISVIILFTFNGLSQSMPAQAQEPTPTVVKSSTPNPVAISDLATETPVLLPTPTVIPTQTETTTPKPTSLPPTLPPQTENTGVYGKIMAYGSDGIIIRKTPDGAGITTIENDHTVELLPDDPVLVDGQEWVHVLVIRQTDTLDGWVDKAYIIFGTPTFTP